jgi:hypothetical protein
MFSYAQYQCDATKRLNPASTDQNTTGRNPSETIRNGVLKNIVYATLQAYIRSPVVQRNLLWFKTTEGARCSVVGWGIMQQVGRLRIRFPMGHRIFFQLT